MQNGTPGGGNKGECQPRDDDLSSCVRLFISGDRSQVGKSSVCMGLLGSFLQLGYPPESLAYIKPATQCEAPQLVTTFCNYHNIECVPIGPIVYFKGFTREYLAGRTESAQEMLQRVSETVDALAQKKRILIIDGVGYPAVGSICGTSNAAVARACGYPVLSAGGENSASDVVNCKRTRSACSVCGATDGAVERCGAAPVLLVGKSGVGDAVDSFNLNATFFEASNVKVLGAVFNRLALEGFYSLDKCRAAIEQYFDQNLPDKHAFGFIPEVVDLGTKEDNAARAEGSSQKLIKTPLEKANEFVFTFMKYVDVLKIIRAAKKARRDLLESHAPSPRITANSLADEVQPLKRMKLSSMPQGDQRIRLTREQVEAAAQAAGAKGG